MNLPRALTYLKALDIASHLNLNIQLVRRSAHVRVTVVLVAALALKRDKYTPVSEVIDLSDISMHANSPQIPVAEDAILVASIAHRLALGVDLLQRLRITPEAQTAAVQLHEELRPLMPHEHAGLGAGRISRA